MSDAEGNYEKERPQVIEEEVQIVGHRLRQKIEGTGHWLRR